jgi:hypothetical protein
MCSKPFPDEDGIDLKLSQEMLDDNGAPWEATIELQLKATSSAAAQHADHISKQLKKDHYNKLATTFTTADRYLVVMVVPTHVDHWLEQDENRLLMKHCVYWQSVRGEPLVEQQASKTVQLPRSNVLNVDALCQMMFRARQRIAGVT